MSGSSSEGPGAVRVRPGTIELNADRGRHERLVLVVTNTGDRPVQIGSHVHLADVNDASSGGDTNLIITLKRDAPVVTRAAMPIRMGSRM